MAKARVQVRFLHGAMAWRGELSAIAPLLYSAERETTSGPALRGRLTVNSNIPFGMLHVMPLIPILERHRHVTLDLMLTTR